MIDILITNGDVFTVTGEGVGYIEEGAVAVDGGTIVAVGPTSELEKEYTAERKIDATMKAVLPGLIDGHLHSVIAITRGLAQDAPTWHEGVDPFFNCLTPDAIQAGAQLAAVEAVRAGTTTLVDYGPGVTFAAPFYEKLGVRAALSCLISELPPIESELGPGELYPLDPGIGESRFMENIELVEKWHGAADGRITTMFGPQGPDYCGTALLSRIREAAEKYDVKLHHHVGQSEMEITQLQKRYGKRPVDFLKDIGYLGERLLAVHMSRCTEEEVAEVARSGASMAFCPSSQVLCDGIVSPADVFSRAGGNVCLGSDETCTNNGTNIFVEMKLAAILLRMKRQDLTEIPTWKILRMATVEGADAVGLGDDIGSLEAGKKADIILIDLCSPGMTPVLRHPVRNIVPNLVLSARGDEVALSIIDGKIIYENGKILTIDENESIAYAQESAQQVAESAASLVQEKN
ncbi:MAG: amidohydrolase family protein, partial [Planctomycetota bacterium]